MSESYYLTPHAPRWGDPLERRTLHHGEQGESAEELEVLSLRAQLREAQAEAWVTEREKWQKTIDLWEANSRGWQERAEQAEAEVERLRAETELTPAQLAAYTLSLEEWRRRGVIEEREACARVADRYGRTFGRSIAAALRARRA